MHGLGATPFQPPPFRARAPWLGADLQTLRNFLVDPGPALPGERLLFDTEDGSGDRLAGLLNRPDDDQRKPLLLLLHGLSGCEDSAYMRHAARFWLDRGHAVLRLNMRGHGPSRRTNRQHFHAGRSADVAACLAALPDRLVRNGVVAVGFSIGGNCLLKYAGEAGETTPLLALATVSAPFDLMTTSAWIGRRRAAPYQRFLLTGFVRWCMADGADLSESERRVLVSARSFHELDDRFVGPRHGFAGAADYYRRACAANVMAEIRRPTLVLHAADDPLVPAGSLRDYRWADNPRLAPVLTSGGGHVGFHGRTGYWHLQAIAGFFRWAGAG